MLVLAVCLVRIVSCVLEGTKYEHEFFIRSKSYQHEILTITVISVSFHENETRPRRHQ